MYNIFSVDQIWPRPQDKGIQNSFDHYLFCACKHIQYICVCHHDTGHSTHWS